MVNNKIRIILIIFMALIAMNSCKKEKIVSNKKSNIEYANCMSLDAASLQIILNHVDFDFDNYVEGVDVHRVYTVSVDGTSYNVLITNAQTNLDVWVADEIANEKEVGVYMVQGLHVGISTNKVSMKFIIVTDEESQYLKNPMSVDQFRIAMPSYVEMVTVRMDAYLVVSVKNGIVRNTVLSKNTSHISWYNRLHEYFEIAKSRIFGTDGPLMMEPGCRSTQDIDEMLEWMREALENCEDFCVDCGDDGDGNIWYHICIHEK